MPRAANRPWKAETQKIRRQTAEERNAKYRALSPTQRLERLDQAGLTAKKEREKIAALLSGKK
jgi:hypothetical protein